MKRSKKDTQQQPVTWDLVRHTALKLPGAEDGKSYGTPAIKIHKKLMIRLREDGESFALACDMEEREALIAEQPDIFYITDHYLNYPWVLARLATVRQDQLSDLLQRAWRRVAPKKVGSRFE